MGPVLMMVIFQGLTVTSHTACPSDANESSSSNLDLREQPSTSTGIFYGEINEGRKRKTKSDPNQWKKNKNKKTTHVRNNIMVNALLRRLHTLAPILAPTLLVQRVDLENGIGSNVWASVGSWPARVGFIKGICANARDLSTHWRLAQFCCNTQRVLQRSYELWDQHVEPALNASIEHNVTITQKYLKPGHTQMECDSVHAAIERKLKNREIHLPSDFLTVNKEARKKPTPYEAIRVDHNLEKDYSDKSTWRYDSIRPDREAGDPVVVPTAQRRITKRLPFFL
ncbi:unnamed protein product [Diatraea saccharalis]|uniref:Uncharacterized protein n=1 Tax=Diatraea saccharalis TaxID=40085 RepID=A0A9N9N4A8_9NEOP|nr:unnamed protein product [Diatraea saccharalis]